jgi:hypothetical protein
MSALDLVRRGIWQQRLFRAIFPMITDPFQNQLARAVARWENEGGAVLTLGDDDLDDRVVLNPIEQGILRCLGAAVIAQWSVLPTEVQKALFQDAVSSGDPRQSTSLREQIARFLHNHKDDADKSAP